MDSYFGTFWLTRLIFQRLIALIYLIAFIVALNQFCALLGQNGLEPASKFIKAAPFKEFPSLFYAGYSDGLLKIVCWTGIMLSLTALFGISEKWPFFWSMGLWLGLWFLYLSIVNVGQTFYRFGWEFMLLEAGFFAAFLGPQHLKPSILVILILRWMLFRTELGAGLIKLRNDPCWLDFSCLFYHYETQPMPNPLSWSFHHFPGFIHRFGAVFSHLVQVAAPFALFGPQPMAAVAGGLIMGHNAWLIISGNYSWLNWLTIALALTAFNDKFFSSFIPVRAAFMTASSLFYEGMVYVLTAAILILSIKPARNLLSPQQLMNTSYNPLHLVNSYGAFGTVTRVRYEIVIEGTDSEKISPQARWKEYEFKGKPGDVKKRPPQIAPYHLRLDWLMWFLPFSVRVENERIAGIQHQRWFIRLVEKILEGDEPTLKLLGHNPFAGKPPRHVRALYYRYEYTTPAAKKETGAWWKRKLIGEYLKPMSLGDFENADRRR